MGTDSSTTNSSPVSPSGNGLGQIGGRPIEVWIVVALFALTGAYLLFVTLKAAPEFFRLFTYSGPFFRLALLFFWFWLVIVAVGAAFLAIAWLIHRGDRVGRGLAMFVAAEWTLAVLFAESPQRSDVLVMIGVLAATTVLFVTPGATTFFENRDSVLVASPTSVVVVRVMVAVVAFFLGISGLLYLVADAFESGLSVVGVVFLVACPAAWIAGQQLSSANQTARIALSVVGGALCILGLIFGERTVGMLQPLAIVAMIPLGLWLPPDARRFFGDSPLGGQRNGSAAAGSALPVALSGAFVRRREVDPTMLCQCGNTLGPDDGFCRQCGAPKPEPPTCDGCGAAIEDDDVFCGSCGEKVPIVSSTEAAPTSVGVDESPESEPPPSREVETAEPACPVCGTALKGDSGSCAHCEEHQVTVTDVTETAPMAMAEATAPIAIAVAPASSVALACSKCGVSAESPDDRFCTSCGHEHAAAPTGCTSCGGPLGDDERFCPNCGSPR